MPRQIGPVEERIIEEVYLHILDAPRTRVRTVTISKLQNSPSPLDPNNPTAHLPASHVCHANLLDNVDILKALEGKEYARIDIKDNDGTILVKMHNAKIIDVNIESEEITIDLGILAIPNS
ncbi:MAG: hypothetical protein AAB553_06890 [Patescibacteria group bacterium]